MSESKLRLWQHALRLTALGVALGLGISVWIAWRTAIDFWAHTAWLMLTLVLSAATVSYGLRALRFYFFLRSSGIAISLADTLIVQTVGFALAITPGRLGEIFKLYLIRERAGISIVRTSPLLVLDRLTEGGSFLLLALITAPLLPSLREHLAVPILMVAGLGVLIVFALTRPLWRALTWPTTCLHARRGAWFLPHLRNLWLGAQTSFTLTQIVGGLLLGAFARMADGLALFWIARMLGATIGLTEAIFILAVSGLAGGISLLPAGLGIVEATLAGLLVLTGVTWTHAWGIALTVRLFTLWLWAAIGLAVTLTLPSPTRYASQVDEDA